MEQVWQRVLRGEHSVAIGELGDVPAEIALIRVRCAGRGDTLGPVLRARERVNETLGLSMALFDAAADRFRYTLRRQLIGEPEHDDLAVELAVAANRLSDQSVQPRALLFERADLADDGTLDVLGRFMARPGWVRLPRVVQLRTTADRPPAEALVATAQRTMGEGSVVTSEGVAAMLAERDGAAMSELDGAVGSLPELPADVRLVMRAAAVVGNPFQVGRLARLLDLDIDTILEALQNAWDLGMDLHDDGDGTFALPADDAEELRLGVLPSLRRHWHARLAESDIGDQPRDEHLGRTAAHLAQAGDLRQAVERYLDASRRSVRLGAYAQALSYLDAAEAELDRRPDTRPWRQLRAQLMLDRGQALWFGGGDGDGSFSLQDAGHALTAASQLLDDEDPAELRAAVAVAQAGVCYDIGDKVTLDAALERLAAASRLLVESGDALSAARLLNDEAAIWVRLGDPVRANHLLERGRQVFEEQAETDPRARLELAQTDHLIARLPMHVKARPGLEREALGKAAERAHSAEAGFAAIGMQREAVRSRTTRGRLAMMAGALQDAEAILTDALREQHAAGDVVGLANTTAALAETFAILGRFGDAARWLAESIDHNRNKGSVLGLEANRALLDRLSQHDKADAGAFDRARGELDSAINALRREDLTLQ